MAMDELQYRVMRNPETLASYRRWTAQTWAAGAPLMLAAIVILAAGGLLIGRALVQPSPLAPIAGGLLALGGGLMMLGVGLVMRRRRKQPWIDPVER
jgi:hypothetical protein